MRKNPYGKPHRDHPCPWPPQFLRRRNFVKHIPMFPLLKSSPCVPQVSSDDENPYAKPHREWRPPRPPYPKTQAKTKQIQEHFVNKSSNVSLIKIINLCTPPLQVSSDDENPYARPIGDGDHPGPLTDKQHEGRALVQSHGVSASCRVWALVWASFNSRWPGWSPLPMGFGIRILIIGTNS